MIRRIVNEDDGEEIDYEVMIVDLGSAKEYFKDDKHIPENRVNEIIGTLSFLSPNILNRVEPSRRDDIFGLILSMIGLINKAVLK